MNSYLFYILIALFIIPGNFGHRNKKHLVALNESASAAARPHFDKGLLLLHNFEYMDASEEFILAQKEDPGFVLSYWGEAMTYDHPIWRDLDIERSRAALKKMGESHSDRLAKAKTDLEKDFLEGVEILFGDGSKPDREKAYAVHMSKLYQKYPDNHDVAAFYALSLLATKKGWDQWEEQNALAAEITNKILKEDPNHAGALHYLVHADDHPLHANNGLAAADKYGKVASYAGHALHMPSHIYLALGMWDDVVRANEVSWQAGVDRKQKKNLTNDQLNYHAHLWLSYGYLQQGRPERAKELIDNQIKFTNELPSARARAHLSQMIGNYLVQTNEWKSPVAELAVKTDDLDVTAQFTAQFLQGYKLFQLGKSGEMKKFVDDYEKKLTNVRQLQKSSEGMTVCGTTRYVAAAPTKNDIENGEAYLKELKGLEAWLHKDMTTADAYFKESLPKEGFVVVGPPYFLISAHELYGFFLLANDRAEEALQQFDKSLQASPNRYVALKGKLDAAKALKNSEIEGTVRKQLQQNFKNAEPVALKGL